MQFGGSSRLREALVGARGVSATRKGRAESLYASHAVLVDELLPDYEFHECHQMPVPVPKDLVRRAAEEWRPEDSDTSCSGVVLAL